MCAYRDCSRRGRRRETVARETTSAWWARDVSYPQCAESDRSVHHLHVLVKEAASLPECTSCTSPLIVRRSAGDAARRAPFIFSPHPPPPSSPTLSSVRDPEGSPTWPGTRTRISNGFSSVGEDASSSPPAARRTRAIFFPRLARHPFVTPLRSAPLRSDAVLSPWCVRRRRRGGGRSVVTRTTLSPAVPAFQSRVTPSTRSVRCGGGEFGTTILPPRIGGDVIDVLLVTLVFKRNKYWPRATLLSFLVQTARAYNSVLFLRFSF